jgi:hypothetical protein
MDGQSLMGVQTSRICSTMLLRTVAGGSADHEFQRELPALIDLDSGPRREAEYIHDQLSRIRDDARAVYPNSPSDEIWAPGLLLPGMVTLWAFDPSISELPYGSPNLVDNLQLTGAALHRLPQFLASAQPRLDCLTPAPIAAWEHARLAGTRVPVDWQQKGN